MFSRCQHQGLQQYLYILCCVFSCSLVGAACGWWLAVVAWNQDRMKSRYATSTILHLHENVSRDVLYLEFNFLVLFLPATSDWLPPPDCSQQYHHWICRLLWQPSGMLGTSLMLTSQGPNESFRWYVGWHREQLGCFLYHLLTFPS